ncbi:MAG: DRTGG domain-containing protein [Bacillota bacterium]
MTLWQSIISSLELKLETRPETVRRTVTGAYCGDLLSDVLARAEQGDLWITIHRHRSVIAVASLLNLSGVVITGNRMPGQDTLESAEKEGIPLFTTRLDNFQASGRLYSIIFPDNTMRTNK